MRIELEKPRRYAMFPKGYAALELSKEESEAIASDIESYLYKKGIIVDNITIKWEIIKSKGIVFYAIENNSS